MLWMRIQLWRHAAVLVDEEAAQRLEGEVELLGLDEFDHLADLVLGQCAPAVHDEAMELAGDFHLGGKEYAAGQAILEP
jgi:hypothetical protein